MDEKKSLETPIELLERVLTEIERHRITHDTLEIDFFNENDTFDSTQATKGSYSQMESLQNEIQCTHIDIKDAESGQRQEGTNECHNILGKMRSILSSIERFFLVSNIS